MKPIALSLFASFGLVVLGCELPIAGEDETETALSQSRCAAATACQIVKRTKGRCVTTLAPDGTSCGEGGHCIAGVCQPSAPMPDLAAPQAADLATPSGSAELRIRSVGPIHAGRALVLLAGVPDPTRRNCLNLWESGILVGNCLDPRTSAKSWLTTLQVSLHGLNPQTTYTIDVNGEGAVSFVTPALPATDTSPPYATNVGAFKGCPALTTFADDNVGLARVEILADGIVVAGADIHPQAGIANNGVILPLLVLFAVPPTLRGRVSTLQSRVTDVLSNVALGPTITTEL